jgi:hypothetical protein
LWQGHPLSPILFKIVADMLVVLINRAKEDGQVSGIILHLVEGGLSILYIMHIASNRKKRKLRVKTSMCTTDITPKVVDD